MLFRGVIVFGLMGCALGSLVFWSSETWAAGNLKLGAFELHPFVEVTGTLDDNVCRTESEECVIDGKAEDGQDFIMLYSPGFLLVLPMRDHEFQAEYRWDIARYTDLDSEDYEDNTVRGNLALNFSRGLSIQAEDTWIDGHDPRGTAQNIDQDFLTKNTATASARLPLGSRFGLQVYDTHFLVDFEKDRNDFRNRTDNTVGGVVFFHALPKTSVLAEYSHTTVSFDEDVDPTSGLNRDSGIHRVLGGIAYEITAKSKGTVKGGYERKKFDEGEREDFSGGIVSVELDHELTPRTLIQAAVERGSRESNLESADFYIITGGSLHVVHSFTGKLAGVAGVSIGREWYPDKSGVEGRSDNTQHFRLGLNYWIQKWLNAKVSYEHTSRSSNVSELEFKDNLYSANLGLFF